MSHASENNPDIQSEPAGNDVIIQNSTDLNKASQLINQYINREGEQILLDIIRNDRPGKEKALLLLGRLYKEERDFDRAEVFLSKAHEAYPLLGDYALNLLIEVYAATEKHEKVIETAPLVKNTLLMQNAKKTMISSLLILSRDREAIETLTDYTRKYPDDWDSRLTLAALHNIEGEINKAIGMFKDIYLSAVPLSDKALSELKVLEADTFTRDDIFIRAENLFKQHLFKKAESEYREVLKTATHQEEKDNILFSIGMCQFRTKRYKESAVSFGSIDTVKAMYWQARSFYRIDDLDEFRNIKMAMEKRYPEDDHLARVILMEAQEYRRQGQVDHAIVLFNKVITGFPKHAEEALWGLGWMNYTSGNYGTSLSHFSQLASYDTSSNYYKYLFWEAKAREKISIECMKLRDDQGLNKEDVRCEGDFINFYYGLPSDASYYGYLIKLKTSQSVPEKIDIVKPDVPEGETYERIEALVFLGMKNDAADEIIYAMKKADTDEEILYLINMAASLGKYKEAIYHAEPRQKEEYLPYSYPLAYWDIIQEAADPEKVEAHLVAAIIREESRFDPRAFSWAGAVGLMQLMPSTAKKISGENGIKIRNGQDLYDPRKNIFLGAQYLTNLIDEFNDLPFAIMAYNAGKNIVNSWIEKYYNDDITEFIENIPYNETRRYIKKVLKSYWKYRSINGLPLEDFKNRG
ncbi:MAG: transglycosylase SLT domain-containing protein [Nitrospiraceae bacterium]|nr:MAG: transglycosylase SLT domain-containing protein [Nitrospiraceae bacterium]